MSKITKINEHIVLLHELCLYNSTTLAHYNANVITCNSATSIMYANTINMQLLAKTLLSMHSERLEQNPTIKYTVKDQSYIKS